MFTRLLIGLDGGGAAAQALEQAIVLGRRFEATLVVAYVRQPEAARPPRQRRSDSGEVLEQARARVSASGLGVEIVTREGRPEVELAALARNADAVLVGRRGRYAGNGGSGVLGTTVTALIRTAERTVIVCGGAAPSAMRVCAVAFDGRETSLRALALAARFASISAGTVHVIHATIDRAMGTMVVGQAEAALSLQGVAFETHLEHGTPGEAVARVVAQRGCDAL
ncbi:MAG: universal stress protein, partial [Gemmatimonadales bacterium]